MNAVEAKSGQAMGSRYMHWARTRSRARFNLATSGLANVKLEELQVSLDELEITGEGQYGYAPLMTALAERYAVDASSIVTAAGTSFANHLALAALINPGDEILIESPAYDPLLAVAHYLGAEVKSFQRRFDDSFRISPAEIERNISSRTKLIVITNFHNPSGVLTDDDTLKEIGELAKKSGARVLVDEVYLEMLLGTASHRLPSGQPVRRDRQSDQGVWLEWTPLRMDFRGAGARKAHVVAKRSVCSYSGACRRTAERRSPQTIAGNRGAGAKPTRTASPIIESVSGRPG